MTIKTEWREGYHLNGALGQQIPYINGMIHGVSKSWSDTGSLECEISYFEDVPHGVVKKWNEDGTLVYRCYYIHGEAQEDLSPLEILILFGEST